VRLDRVALKSGTDISMLVFQTIGTKFRMYMDGIKNPKVVVPAVYEDTYHMFSVLVNDCDRFQEYL